MAELLPGPNADLDALRRFASVKLVVADLDGTLFPSELAGKAQRLLRQLNHVGVQLTIATGRTFSGVRELLSRLRDSPERPLIKHGTPLILYNGSVVIDAETGRMLRRNTMTNFSLELVLNRATNHRCELFAYFCDDEPIGQDRSGDLQERVFGWQFKLRGEPRGEFEFNGIRVEWEAPHLLPDKLQPCAVVVKSPQPDVLASLARELTTIESVSVTRSGTVYLELRPQGSNKGNALAWVAQRLALSADQVLAVGDNDNDVEMLKWAGIGVAVSTASDSARAHADFICDYGPFQGVIQVLGLVREAHRYYRNSENLRPIAT